MLRVIYADKNGEEIYEIDSDIEIEEYNYEIYDEIVVYCHHGIRSLDAIYLLQQIGFKRVSSLVGGIDRWSREIDPNINQY